MKTVHILCALLVAGLAEAGDKFAGYGKIIGYSTARTVFENWLGADFAGLQTVAQRGGLCLPSCETTKGREQMGNLIPHIKETIAECASIADDSTGYPVTRCLMSTAVITRHIQSIIPAQWASKQDELVTTLKSVIDIEISDTNEMNWGMSIFRIVDEVLKSPPTGFDMDIFLDIVKEYVTAMADCVATQQTEWREMKMEFTQTIFKSVQSTANTKIWVETQLQKFRTAIQHLDQCGEIQSSILENMIKGQLDLLTQAASGNSDNSNFEIEWLVFTIMLSSDVTGEVCQPILEEQEVLAPPSENLDSGSVAPGGDLASSLLSSLLF